MKKSLYRFIASFIYLVLGSFGIAISFGAFGVLYSGPFYVYYTNLGNYFCYLYILIEVIYNIYHSCKEKKINYVTLFPSLKFALGVGLFIISIASGIMLGDSLGYFWTEKYWTNLLNPSLHVGMPIMYAILYFVFSDRRYTKWTPLLELIVPGVYALFILFRAIILGSNYDGVLYPYRFINPLVVGWPRTIVTCVIVAAIYLLIGYTVIFVYNYFIKNKVKEK